MTYEPSQYYLERRLSGGDSVASSGKSWPAGALPRHQPGAHRLVTIPTFGSAKPPWSRACASLVLVQSRPPFWAYRHHHDSSLGSVALRPWDWRLRCDRQTIWRFASAPASRLSRHLLIDLPR